MKIVFWVSNMWQDILKIQVLDTTSSLSSINEPMMEDKNCCELAREKFLEEHTNFYDSLDWGQVNPSDGRELYIRYFEEILAMSDCKTFREVLQDVKNRYKKDKKDLESSRPYINTLRFWEECEK
jgi:hypothetical protein